MVTGVVVALYGRCRGHLRHTDGARIDPIRAAVRREHERVPGLPEMNAGAGIVEDPVGRLPVQQPEVICFQKVLQHDFVIAAYLHAPLMDEPQGVQRQMPEIPRDRIEEMLQRWSVVRFADEDPVAEHLAAERDEVPARPVQGAPIPRVRDRGQGAGRGRTFSRGTRN